MSPNNTALEIENRTNDCEKFPGNKKLTDDSKKNATENQASVSRPKVNIISDIKLKQVPEFGPELERNPSPSFQNNLNLNTELEREKNTQQEVTRGNKLERKILGDILVFPKQSNAINKKKFRTILPSVLIRPVGGNNGTKRKRKTRSLN